MSNQTKKKPKRMQKKTVFGIKLPPIEPAKDDTIKTVLDIDSEFFSMIDGRPIRPQTSISAYKQNLKEIGMKRVVHGYLKDEISRLNRDMSAEEEIYEKAIKDFDGYQNSFEKFLAHDNNKTIAIMQKSDALAKDVANITEEFKQAKFEMATLRAKLLYVDESLSILLSLENFLHKASPILWQQNNNIVLDKEHKEILELNHNIYEKIDVNKLREKLKALPAPRLYFETPEQLLDVFQLLEMQNLNYLLVTEELSSNKNKFLQVLTSLKANLKVHLAEIQEKISDVEDIISFYELKEADLKEIFFKILDDKIRYLISSEMTLKINNYVEYTFEYLITPNETKFSAAKMMQLLEREFNNLQLELSVFDLDMVKAIEKETYGDSIKEMKQAVVARQLLKDVQKLDKRLKASFEPSRKMLT